MAGVSGNGDVQPHRSHRSRQAGPSAKKKSNSDKRKRDISEEKKHNPKVYFHAFQVLYLVKKVLHLVVCGVILCLVILINHMDMFACVY